MCPEHAGSARVSSVHQEQKSGNSFVRECAVAKLMLELCNSIAHNSIKQSTNPLFVAIKHHGLQGKLP
jgi:hypothetical protein